MTLPVDLVTALETIPLLAAWPSDAWQVDRLGGVTNRNFRLRRGASSASTQPSSTADDYVLRLPGHGTSSYLNRPAGIHNAALAAAQDIAPPVLFSDPERGWQVSRYLDHCRPLTGKDLQDPPVLTKVGRLLGRLQRLPAGFQHEMRPFVIADRYLDLAPEQHLIRLRQSATQVEREIEDAGIALVPAHIDPNPTNFLLDSAGRLHLIDWEFSAMADPCWDLAAIALEGDLAPPAIAILLAAAGQPTDSVMLRRMALFQCALCLVASSWCYVEIAAGNDSADLKDFAEQRRDAFAAWLDKVQ